MTQTVLLGDVATIQTGPFGSQLHQKDYVDIGTPIVTVEHLGQDRLTRQNLPLVSDGDKKRLNKYILKEGDTVFSRVGSVDRASYVHAEENGWMFSGRCLRVSPDPNKVDPRFLSFLLRSPKFTDYIKSVAVGATMPSINTKLLSSAPIVLPDPQVQQIAAESLDSIEQKTELNRKMNKTLEQMGQALFKHYFITNPAAKEWKDGVLGDIIVNFDSKRKPLSSRQRSEMQGDYRYFGATSVMDYINDYLFNGAYLLLAEDGSVIKKDGTPYLQYVWGKFWVNNHAHILQAKAPFTVEYLYLLLSQVNVQSIVSGAVQLKINQKAMNGFKIKLPPEELVQEFCDKIDPLFAQRRKNEEQIQTLTILRDTLLPRLISGKVKV